MQGQVKYVMLNPSSKLKGEKDWQKYETARKLAKCVDKIRQDYREDWKSKEMRIRQRAVAMYFIDIVSSWNAIFCAFISVAGSHCGCVLACFESW